MSSIVKAVISIYRRDEVDVLLNNETNSYSEIKRVASFKKHPLLILELIRPKFMTQSTR